MDRLVKYDENLKCLGYDSYADSCAAIHKLYAYEETGLSPQEIMDAIKVTDETPPKIRCPKCGELCRKVYRTAKHGDFIGCDACVSELYAVADADANPEEYGLEEME